MGKVKSYFLSSKVNSKPEEVVYVNYEDFKSEKKLASLDDSFALVLFESGNGIYSLDSQHHPVKPKQVYILLPEQKYQWKLESGTQGQILLLKKALIETFPATLQFSFSRQNLHPILDLDSITYQKVNADFLAVKKELYASTIFPELVNARCRLIALLITLWVEHKFGNIPPHHSNSLTYKFQALVDKHFKTQKSVAFYANHLCVTPNYLGVICRQQYKMSPLEFIQERILLEAKRLLHSSDRSIKEIAFDLGFKNQTYFGYFFKTKTSLTPIEYKRLLEKS